VTPVNHRVRTAALDYELRLDRNGNPHLAFGEGEHFCLGSHLARKTTGSLLRELLPRLEHVKLAGKPEHPASNLMPGLQHLRIRYRIRPALRAGS
jgi:cytochrome P450